MKHKKRLLVLLVIPLSLALVTFFYFVQNKTHILEGTLLEKNKTTFTIDYHGRKAVGSYPETFDSSQITVGDKLKVYYDGEILEIDPVIIKHVIKIKRL